MTDKTTDVDGKPWAKLSELKPGDILIPDGGFTCMKEGARLTVGKNNAGELFLPCRHKGHTLVGQADDGEHLIGLYRDPLAEAAQICIAAGEAGVAVPVGLLRVALNTTSN